MKTKNPEKMPIRKVAASTLLALGAFSVTACDAKAGPPEAVPEITQEVGGAISKNLLEVDIGVPEVLYREDTDRLELDDAVLIRPPDDQDGYDIRPSNESIENHESLLETATLCNFEGLTIGFEPRDSERYDRWASSIREIDTQEDGALQKFETAFQAEFGIELAIPLTLDDPGGFYVGHEHLFNIDDLQELPAALKVLGFQLSLLPEEMIRVADLDRINIAGRSLTHSGRETGGLYYSDSNIVLSYDDINPPVIVHEFAHAVDNAACPNLINDPEFEAERGEDGIEDYDMDALVDSDLLVRGPNLVYWTEYSAIGGPVEEKAEIMTKLFMIGPVLPSDSYWGSPYQKKEQILLNRLFGLGTDVQDYLIRVSAHERGKDIAEYKDIIGELTGDIRQEKVDPNIQTS